MVLKFINLKIGNVPTLKNICVNTIKKEYKFDKKFGYLIISSN